MQIDTTKFFVLDFDRTLGSTVLLYELFQEIVESVVDNEAVRRLDSVRHAVEDDGGSFDSITYVQDILASAGKADSWQQIEDEFITRAHQSGFLEPGAERLINYLDTHHYSYGIVTYGGESWQRLKIRAVGLDGIPAIVTKTQGKGELIASWCQVDGRYEVPGSLNRNGEPLTVESIVLIDDNALNFEGLPSDAVGYYIQNTTTRDRSNQLTAPIPRHIRTVPGLNGVIRMLEHDIDKA